MALSLPHLLLYADDVMLFAMSPAELQLKLRDLADCLAAIGLHVNPRSCAVLNTNGTTPGIWFRGSCRAAGWEGPPHVPRCAVGTHE